jgi:hypothetical protein
MVDSRFRRDTFFRAPAERIDRGQFTPTKSHDESAEQIRTQTLLALVSSRLTVPMRMA